MAAHGSLAGEGGSLPQGAFLFGGESEVEPSGQRLGSNQLDRLVKLLGIMVG